MGGWEMRLDRKEETEGQINVACTKPFLTWANAKAIFTLNKSEASSQPAFKNSLHGSITKNIISEVTGCFIWLLSSRRSHLGIWDDKNVSSARCFAFQCGIFPWSPNLGENDAREEQEETQADSSWCQCFLPCSPGGPLGEKADLAGNEACLWVCTGRCHLDGKLPPRVWPLSCFIKIFLFSSLSYSSREAGPFKRSAMTLIACFQKAHEPNLEPYGCADLADQPRSLTNTEENDV